MGRTFLRYFDYSEFDCYYEENSGYKHMDREFMLMLDEARHLYGLDMKIMRAYVSPKLRPKLSIVNDSPHLLGKAACIWCKHPEKRYRMVAALLEVGFHRIGIGPDYIYIDNDEARPPMLTTFIKDASLNKYLNKSYTGLHSNPMIRKAK